MRARAHRLRAIACSSACMLLLSCGDDPSSLEGGAARRSSSSGSSSSGTSGSEQSSGSVLGAGATANEVCWSTINAYRKRDGLPALARWTDGETCADGEAQTDAQTNRPHGAFPRCGETAQNECPGVPGPASDALPDCLAVMWAEGAGGGHHDNMASTRFKKVACGVFVTSRGVVWSVQNFR